MILCKNKYIKKIKNMDCYKCMHKGCVPGSAHSRCLALRNSSGDPDGAELFELEILLATHQCELKINGEPMVKIDECGIRNGWASFPLDFDPVWLSECKLFKEKTN